MKNNQTSMKFAVKEVSNPIEIIQREKDPEEIRTEHFFQNYVKIMQSNLDKWGIDKNKKNIEIINEDGLMISDCSKGLIDEIIMPEQLKLLAENPIKLEQIGLVCAVMPYDDIFEVITSLSTIPEISDTKVLFGIYGDKAYFRDCDYNTRILQAFTNGLDFYNISNTSMNEPGYGKSYYKMAISDYKPNYSKRHF